MAAAVFSAGRVTALLCSVPLFEMPPFVLFLKHTCVDQNRYLLKLFPPEVSVYFDYP